jgi:hypothetical protein
VYVPRTLGERLDEARRRLVEERQAREARERERVTELQKRDESPAERLDRLQREAQTRRDPAGEIDKQLREQGQTTREEKRKEERDREEAEQKRKDRMFIDPPKPGRDQAQPSPTADTADRAALDGSLAKQTNTAHKLEGKMEVNFTNVPRRTRMGVKGNGVFKDTRVSKTPEMAHTGSGTRDAEQYAEE